RHPEHDRDRAPHEPGCGHGDHRRRHEGGGRFEDAVFAVDPEEDDEGADLDQELDQRMHVRQPSRPTRARAKLRASNGCRSSTASPTPIAWMGRANFSASATSTPPLAVPSSLVMTMPVTWATSRKASVWDRAF